MDYRIYPPEMLSDSAIATLPVSKSIVNRMLVIAAVAGRSFRMNDGDVLSDDIRVMHTALSRPTPTDGSTVDVEAAGTALRFLTAYFATTPDCDVVLDGTPRLRERPMAPLIEALRSMGADITCTLNEGHAPMHIRGKQLQGGRIDIDGTQSSQFATALLLVAPRMAQGLTLHFDGTIASEAYLKMTMALIHRCGVEVEKIDPLTFEMKAGQHYNIPADLLDIDTIEADWSAASYWLETAALSGLSVLCDGLRPDSVQGDSAAPRIFAQVGVDTNYRPDPDDYPDVASLQGITEFTASPEIFSFIDLDMSNYPDLVPALAVTAALVGSPFRLTGVSTLRHKETDRLAAIATEMAKMGIDLDVLPDALVWEGRNRSHPIFELPRIDTYADHRMAMAFAPASIMCPGMIINDIEVVSKSYPAFWDNLRALGFELEPIGVTDPQD